MKVLCGTLIILLAAAAIVVSAGTTVVIMRTPAAGGVTCTSAGSSDFSADPQTDGSWNTDLEEDATGFSWDATNNRENGSSAGSGTQNALTYTASAASSSDMWIKVKIVTLAVGIFGATIRRSTSGGARYVFYVAAGAAQWAYWDGGGSNAPSVIEALNSCGTFTSGDTIGIQITGTGNDTVVKCWENPSGNDPDDWGAAGHTATSDPSTAVDSGTYGGLFQATSNATRRTGAWDDFSVGSCQ
jgi:hypothetical protein